MPLTQEQEDAEHELRMEMMALNIAKLRADLDMQREELKKNSFNADMELRKLRRQTVTVVLQAIGLLVAGFAAGITWVHYH